MDVGLLFVTLLLTVIPEAALHWTKLCTLGYRSNCNWFGLGCDLSTLYCNKVIECDGRTTINIIQVNYGVNLYVDFDHCQHVCNGAFWYSHSFTSSLMYLCNGKQVCELSQWNVHYYWKLHVNNDCKERIYQRYTMKINTTSVKPRMEATSTHVPSARPQPPQTTTSSRDASTVTESATKENKAPDTRPVKSQTEATKTQVPTTRPRPSQTTTSSSDANRVIEYETKENIKTDQFPVSAVAASVSAGIVVLVIVVIVVVCIKRRRRIIKSNQTAETTLQMQIVSNNSYGYSPPPVNRQDQQEIDEHAYVDITLQSATDTADSKFEHRYVNADKEVDTNDEYNTLNTRPTPFRIDPNYDHLPKGSHTAIDETYSHATDGQTTMLGATYTHLKDIKSAASRIKKINQNNSDNVINHINTKSVGGNVYNNSKTSFNRSSLSHLGTTKSVEDDYDHTDWKQTNTNNSKSKNIHNEAVGKFETNNITERAHDEYAVVNKRSDKVESSDGHNYFVLEKQFL